VIGFIGTVFSPWYAWSGRGDPANHACINVATFGHKPRFTMTDRGRAALVQTKDALQVGPSRMAWQGGTLVIDINEISAPPRIGRVQGQIRLTPSAITEIEARLTPDGRHIWRPFAPIARIEVDISPGHRWSGHGYFDANFGTDPLEADFTHWTWGRYPRKQGASVYYDALRRDGSRLELGLDFAPDGGAAQVTPPPIAALPRTAWGIARTTRSDAGTKAHQRMALLEAPFYARTMMDTTLHGERVTGMHETLDLTRYDNKLIQAMVACRVPRRVSWA
jgi:carotenoid 1,2-hydratase